jgi:dolichol kinase
MAARGSPACPVNWRRLIHVLVHVGFGVLIVILPLISAAAVLTTIAVLASAAEVYRLRPRSKLNDWVTNAWPPVVKPWEGRRPSAPTWSCVGLAALLWTCLGADLPKSVVALAAFVLAVGDPAAGLCRTALSRPQHWFARRCVGSIVFLLAAISVLCTLTWTFPRAFGPAAGGLPTILAGLAASGAELLSVKQVDDNGVVPAATVTTLAAAGGYDHTRVRAVGTVLVVLVITIWLVNATVMALRSAPRAQR